MGYSPWGCGRVRHDSETERAGSYGYWPSQNLSTGDRPAGLDLSLSSFSWSLATRSPPSVPSSPESQAVSKYYQKNEL